MASRGVVSTGVLSLSGTDYRLDQEGFLVDPDDWNENFAEGMARLVGVPGALTERQWEVIRFIRRFWQERGSCPTVYQTCRILGLHLAGFHFLFPSGYQRGACKVAGISYKSGFSDYPQGGSESTTKSYRIDIWGFLLDPDEWDDRFALLKAHEMKLPEGLTTEHWRFLRFLREEYYRVGKVPTVSRACEGAGIGLDDLEELFPDGYHRGAVKIAGLPSAL
jgi:TusE/DsrC/DsvC family sulfur relay protein